MSATPSIRVHDAVVIGGGCYGSYHARQLIRAAKRGAFEFRQLIIVDRASDCAARLEFGGHTDVRFVVRDWVDFVDDYLGVAPVDSLDVMVPTPIGPHLMFEWLKRRATRLAGARKVSLSALPETPYTARSDDGTGYLSFATWTCPVTCIEPAICPVTRGPKAWEMDEAVFSFARGEAGSGRPFDDVQVFRCRPLAFGISAWPTSQAVAARERLDLLMGGTTRAQRSCRVLVATTSSCHGVVDLLEFSGLPGGSTSSQGPNSRRLK